jgi:hypothetical protein
MHEHKHAVAVPRNVESWLGNLANPKLFGGLIGQAMSIFSTRSHGLQI